MVIRISHRDPVREWLEKNKDILPKGKVLEFGCGGGCFSDWFNSNGFQWECITKEYPDNHLTIKSGLIEELNKENEYDIIFSCHVFEHCEQPIIALKRILKALKSNGMLILATPLFVRDQILEGSDDDHIFVLNEWQLMKLLKFTNYKKIRIEKTGDHNRRDSHISVGYKNE